MFENSQVLDSVWPFVNLRGVLILGMASGGYRIMQLGGGWQHLMRAWQPLVLWRNDFSTGVAEFLKVQAAAPPVRAGPLLAM